MSLGNVVTMQGTKRSAKRSPNHSRRVLPPVYQSVKNLAHKHMVALIQGLFDNTDDALFELADKSQSDQQQEMYFDSMRHIRLHRKSIGTDFLKNFEENFDALLNTESELVEEDLDAEDYSLVDQDELEMSVAVSGIASKVTSIFSLPIMQLTKRFGEVVKPIEVTERSNPLGPHALSSAFADSLSGLDVNIKIRIILMKLFERFVMERMGPVYDEVNNKLIQSGVLPDLKGIAKQKRMQRKSPLPASSKTSEPSDSGSEDFGFQTVQNLLANTRAGGAHGSGGTNGGGGSTGSGGTGTSGPMITIPSSDVLVALSELQKSTSSESIDPDRIPEQADLRNILLTGAGAGKSLGQADDDTVNFVGMLFDYILNDRNLAIPMKALIGRLQIPIVKLGLLDKTFFSNGAHPARLLLNELSSAGIGWSSGRELKRDALYEKIESIVAKVLTSFSDDPNLFTDLLRDLRSFVSQDTRRNVLVEQRVKDTEHGKAKSHQAKRVVQTLINQKACGLRLPSQVGKFLSEVWSRVLTLRWAKHGESSQEWQEGVHTLDTLLWSLQPLAEVIDIEQRDELKEDLINAIAVGADSLGMHTDEIEEYVGWLDSHLNELSDNDRAYVEEDERPEPSTPAEDFPEIVLTADDLVELTASEEALLKPYTEGTWVELKTEDDTIARCKLSTVTYPTHQFIFVNRRGMKVFEKSATDMLDLISAEKIRLIDESQVFDRALQSVIGNLRKLHRQAS